MSRLTTKQRRARARNRAPSAGWLRANSPRMWFERPFGLRSYAARNTLPPIGGGDWLVVFGRSYCYADRGLQFGHQIEGYCGPFKSEGEAERAAAAHDLRDETCRAWAGAESFWYTVRTGRGFWFDVHQDGKL